MYWLFIKTARQHSGFTIEELAERGGVTDRYIYRIKSEGQRPSYDVLYKLIRELSIDPNLISYPEKPVRDSQIEDLIRMLYRCDECAIAIITATIKVSLDSQIKCC